MVYLLERHIESVLARRAVLRALRCYSTDVMCLQLGFAVCSWCGHLSALLTCATPEADGRVRSLWAPLWAATVRQARKLDSVSDVMYVRLLADQVRVPASVTTGVHAVALALWQACRVCCVSCRGPGCVSSVRSQQLSVSGHAGAEQGSLCQPWRTALQHVAQARGPRRSVRNHRSRHIARAGLLRIFADAETIATLANVRPRRYTSLTARVAVIHA